MFKQILQNKLGFRQSSSDSKNSAGFFYGKSLNIDK